MSQYSQSLNAWHVNNSTASPSLPVASSCSFPASIWGVLVSHSTKWIWLQARKVCGNPIRWHAGSPFVSRCCLGNGVHSLNLNLKYASLFASRSVCEGWRPR